MTKSQEVFITGANVEFIGAVIDRERLGKLDFHGVLEHPSKMKKSHGADAPVAFTGIIFLYFTAPVKKNFSALYQENIIDRYFSPRSHNRVRMFRIDGWRRRISSAAR